MISDKNHVEYIVQFSHQNLSPMAADQIYDILDSVTIKVVSPDLLPHNSNSTIYYSNHVIIASRGLIGNNMELPKRGYRYSTRPNKGNLRS